MIKIITGNFIITPNYSIFLEKLRCVYPANPTQTLSLDNSKEDRKYYIDFSSVRGEKVIEDIKNRITFWSSDEPTCQLFTGHIGCGKTTELRRLKAELTNEDYHVVYFESDEDLEMTDVDVGDILLAIARRIDTSLKEAEIQLNPTGFKKLLLDVGNILNSEVTGLNLRTSLKVGGEKLLEGELGFNHNKKENETSISFLIGDIILKAKDSPKLRDKLRGYLEPQVNRIIKAINTELIEPSIKQLKQRDKKGLVVIIDNFDRVVNTKKPWGRNQPEYLFIDRGEQLSRLNCHLVYTIPSALRFVNEANRLKDRFGNIYCLPMIAIKSHDGNNHEEGLNFLRKMVLARAFPQLSEQKRFENIGEVFDIPETLDRLCLFSGGHVRQLLRLLNQSIATEMKLPISRQSLDKIIKEEQNFQKLSITKDQWPLLRQIKKSKKVTKETEEDNSYDILMRNLLVFEYKDQEGDWFNINPILASVKELKDE